MVADGREDGALPLQPASEVAARLRALVPAPWETRYPGKLDETLAGMPETGLNVLWLSDGLDHPGRGGLLSALGARGGVTVVPPLSAPQSLELVAGERPALRLRVAGAGAGNPPEVLALGLDPQGAARELARLKPGAAPTGTPTGTTTGTTTPTETTIDAGVTTHTLPIELPSELRNRITRFEIAGQRSAGAVVLADDSVRRRKVALVGDDRATEGQRLSCHRHRLRPGSGPRAGSRRRYRHGDRET